MSLVADILNEVRSWDGFPWRTMTGDGPRSGDTPPERTYDGDFIFYHGTSRAGAKSIMQGGDLHPDNWGVVGVATIPGQARVFAIMAAQKAGETQRPLGAVLRVAINQDWLADQLATPEVGGSGHDQFLIRAYGIPANAIRDISVVEWD